VTQTKSSISHRALLVDDDEAVRSMMSRTLEGRGFEVVPAASVIEALKLISTETSTCSSLIPSDGFAVVTAMRRSQPDALTLLVSGYPDVKSAMDAILLEADDIIVKPFEAENRKPSPRMKKERVARDFAALYQRYCRELVSASKKEQRTQSHCADRQGAHRISSPS
jgi:ActR/RegA family two-component response regulator